MPGTKAIKLTALDGFLEGPIMEVPCNTKEWNVPIRRDVPHYQPFAEDDLSKVPLESMFYVTFRTKNLWVTLPNGRDCELYELDLNGLTR